MSTQLWMLDSPSWSAASTTPQSQANPVLCVHRGAHWLRLQSMKFAFGGFLLGLKQKLHMQGPVGVSCLMLLSSYEMLSQAISSPSDLASQALYERAAAHPAGMTPAVGRLCWTVVVCCCKSTACACKSCAMMQLL